MVLSGLDWLVLAAVLVLPALIGIRYCRRSGASVGQFFLSGRDLPWWLAGTSMVATTFAADTPLAVTGLVAANGIAGNWIWWNAALGSMLTVFFFARLWRRAGIVTDVEFAELRYSGRPAAFLRGFRAVYLGLVINCLIIGWVNLALSKILLVTLGWDRLTAVFVGLAATGLYAAAAGLRGVVVTDFLLFALASAGSVALALFAVSLPEIGGLEGLVGQLPPETFRLLPALGSDDGGAGRFALPLAAFVAYLGVQWWASWYPGQEPGGGGYIAQRMMATRNERHATLAMLWFAVAHFCLRPWPWVLVALSSLVLYPGLADAESGYVLVMRDHLPSGWRGLLVGAFFAAYVSTVSTQLNWGTSYLINDVYARFVRTAAHETELVRVSRITTLVVMVISGVVTFYLESIRQAWEFALESGAGVGLVLIVRWYWWRVNAASEIAALAAAALGFLGIHLLTDIRFPISLLVLVPWTTWWWLLVMWMTPAEPHAHLARFYARVRPAGPGWRRVAAESGGSPPAALWPDLTDWLAGCTCVYGLLVTGWAVLFGSTTTVSMALAAALLGGLWLTSRARMLPGGA